MYLALNCVLCGMYLIFFLMMRTFKIYSLDNFQIYNIVLYNLYSKLRNQFIMKLSLL